MINLLPVSGVVSGERLQALYGVAVESSDLEILMRHRAVLLAIVGGVLFASALHAPLRPVGFAVGLVSMASFILVAWLVGKPNAELRRVVAADLVALAALLGAALVDRLGAAGALGP